MNLANNQWHLSTSKRCSGANVTLRVILEINSGNRVTVDEEVRNGDYHHRMGSIKRIYCAQFRK